MGKTMLECYGGYQVKRRKLVLLQLPRLRTSIVEDSAQPPNRFLWGMEECRSAPVR